MQAPMVALLLCFCSDCGTSTKSTSLFPLIYNGSSSELGGFSLVDSGFLEKLHRPVVSKQLKVWSDTGLVPYCVDR